MRDEDDAYRVHLNADSRQAPHDSLPSPDGPQASVEVPFCLGILGDFSGREGRSGMLPDPRLHERPLVRVTPENVLHFGAFSPRVRVGAAEGTSAPEEVEISTFDDFHPDQLFQRLSVLEPYRLARQRLLDEEAGAIKDADSQEDSPTPPSTTGLLDAVLEETREELASGNTDLDEDLDGFIRRVVRPHVVDSGPDRTQEVTALDAQTSIVMSQVMHEPGFQALESLWRSVVFLLSRIEVSTKLRVYLVDVSKSDLKSDLLGTDEPSEWTLGGLIFDPVSENGEGLRWAALIGAYEFGREPDDIPMLQRIAFLAEAAEVPWFAAGDSRLFGCDSLATTPDPRDWTEPVDPLWDQLRQNPEANWIGLAAPPFLVRPVYGLEGMVARTFDFTESVQDTADLLRGNPAFLCGMELTRNFAKSGWGLRPSGQFVVENVPLHTTEDGWASPVTQVLSQSAASRVSDSGLIPVLGYRNDSVIRVPGVRSVAKEENDLKGWWSSDR